MNRYGPWFLTLLFVVGCLAVLHFLAVDSCADSGGVVTQGGLSCDTSSNQVVSLFLYVGLLDVIISAVVAAIPVGLILCFVHGSRGARDTPNT